ncbi:MAG: 2-hydroxychromene-2-carboxylate isomerase [SAR324 cluster bacterium]|nr:2-hydroxychromene-2-carboxylate isomerase [SAR324 cluster bacterium]
MSKATVDFYFDFSSPYSYIASCLIEKVCEDNDTELRWQPLVIGGLFKSNNTTPPFTIPNRARYMAADLESLAGFYGIPYKQRTHFLFSPILALRATLAASPEGERGKAVHALFHGAWAKDLDLGDQEVATGLLNDAGLNGATLVERTKDDTIKSELRGNTDRADGLGIFGAPFSVVNEGEKMFWGHDRLELLGHYLASA